MPGDCGEIMEPVKQHFRIKYKKGQELRYTANLDVHKIWERYFRRARIPLAYSKGFHPQPRINQALPLPLGMLSEFELLEFWIEADSPIQLNGLREKFSNVHQPGIEVLEVNEILEKQKSLQSLVQSVKYAAEQFYQGKNSPAPLTVDELLAQENIVRVRRKKEYDLHPLILDLYEESANPRRYVMHLTALPGKSGRPDEVLSALGFDSNCFRIVRTGIILSD